MFVIYFNVQKLRDSKVIPKTSKEDKRILFYELSIRCSCCREVIARIPFGPSDESVWCKLCHCDESPGEYIPRRIYNFFHDSSWEFFIHKVLLIKDDDDDRPEHTEDSPILTGSKLDEKFLQENKIAYIRHLTEDNTTGEKYFLMYNKNTGNFENNFVKIVSKPGLPIKNPLKNMRVHKYKLENWSVNRSYYKRTHVVQNDFSAKFFYHNLLMLLTVESGIKDIDTFIKRFHEVFNRYVRYDNDRRFSDFNVITDHNDESVELSYLGDCEDMCHMYLRIFNTLHDIYHFIDSKISHIVNEFFTNYKPMAFICRIDNRKWRLEFHCTMLILPLKTDRKPFVFEVTTPKVHGQFIDENSPLYDRYKMQHALLDRLYWYQFPDFNKKIIHETFLQPEKFFPI